MEYYYYGIVIMAIFYGSMILWYCNGMWILIMWIFYGSEFVWGSIALVLRMSICQHSLQKRCMVELVIFVLMMDKLSIYV